MYQTGHTIQKTLEQIHRRELVLPAIQREFVWRPEQICRLFDSIMQGFPFGTFLYWRAEPENSGNFKFFGFVQDYHQRDQPHCPPLGDMSGHQLTAVLDGQQRLTALYIGLRGSMALKQPRKWWKSPDAFPKQRLHLDLLWQADSDDEEGMQYKFKFLTDKKRSDADDGTWWFPVSKILSVNSSGPPMLKWLSKKLGAEQAAIAYEPLYQLWQVVRKERLIAYFEEDGQELDKALQIFIRMNDGGTPLSHSDLLLSVATAQWTDHDARQEIHELVDELNRIHLGFDFSKDLVLKAGLMLSDIGSVGFRVDNFNRQNMDVFEKKWENIKTALQLTVQLVAMFGFSGRSLTAHNSILPIAYYLYVSDPGQRFLTHKSFEKERRDIREWLIKSLLKSGVWGSGLDTLLTDLRRVISESYDDGFPTSRIHEAMARRGRDLTFNDEEIEDLVDMRYGDRLTFALLSMLFPFVDLRQQFHVDHIYPSAQFSKRRLKKAGVPEDMIEDYRDLKDGLANLQLLQGTENAEKSDAFPAEWLSRRYVDSESRQDYKERHLLGDLPDSIMEFDTFFEMRRDKLKARVGQLLGSHTP